MEVRISVLSNGDLLVDGQAAQLSTIKDALERADRTEDVVLYYRESPQGEAPPEARDVLNLIIAQKLPVSFCGKPDFSDYVDRFGQSHPRPIDVRQTLRDPTELHMPDVDLRRSAEDVFAEARRVASKEEGPSGVVIVRPDRRLLVLPALPASPQNAQLSKQLPAVIPMDHCCNIAVIGNTASPALQNEAPPSILDANQAIPFLGFLIGWSQAGHRVWVFEGHPSALAAGLTDSDLLLLDSGMLEFLQSDWMAVAKRSMRPGGRVFLHDRKKYRLLPLAATDKPPGWLFAEPDGEASYVNCLLTTLAKGNAPSVEIVSGSPLPDLAGLTTNADELEWIAGLPFRYDLLDAEKVIAVLLNAAGRGKVDPFQKEWIFPTKLVSQGSEPRIQTFVLRRERRWLKTVLHIGKR